MIQSNQMTEKMLREEIKALMEKLNTGDASVNDARRLNDLRIGLATIERVKKGGVP